MPDVQYSESPYSRVCGKPTQERRPLFAIVISVLACGGCTLTPRGTSDEKARLHEAGVRYETPIEQREIPDLPAAPTWRDVLSRAFLANGDVEAAYFQWKAAIDRIDVAGSWPNTDVNLGYSYMFSRERMSTFDRMTFTAGFDAMENLSWPGKTMQAAKVALDEARGAAERFRAVKFDLQRKVLFAWADYQQQAALLRIGRDDLALRKAVSESELIRAQISERQRDVLQSQLESRMAQDSVQDLEAEHQATRALLNALMGREPRAELPAPDEPSPLRPVPKDDAALIAAAADTFPEVSEFAREVESRKDALQLARMRWIPDINPSVAFTGGIAQAIGFTIVLPTTIAEIQGQIREAQALLRASEATLRQSKSNRIGDYVQLLIMLRSAQRRSQFFEREIRPLAQRLNDDQRFAYETGGASLTDWIESRKMLLEVRRIEAQARGVIEKAIVDIECCLGVDIETIPSSTAMRSGDSSAQEQSTPASEGDSMDEHHE